MNDDENEDEPYAGLCLDFPEDNPNPNAAYVEWAERIGDDDWEPFGAQHKEKNYE